MIDEKRLYAALGAKLKRLREADSGPNGKLTQAKLAQEVGVERTSITNIEQGNQKVPLHVLYRICEVLHVSVVDLLPSLSEVKPVPVSTTTGELLFQGRNVKTTPRVAEILTQLANARGANDQGA